jgi:hypothetical protein
VIEERRHIRDDQARTRFEQVRRAGRGGDGNHRHASLDPGFDSRRGVFQDDAMGRRDAEQARGRQVGLRVGFAVGDVVRSNHHGRHHEARPRHLRKDHRTQTGCDQRQARRRREQFGRARERRRAQRTGQREFDQPRRYGRGREVRGEPL